MSFFLVINILFLIALVIHVVLIAYSMLYPSTPSIKIYEKRLNETEFPISIKLCALEDRESDTMRHNTSGYERNFRFFLGQSMFNKSLIGWSGHNEDGSVLGSVRGKKYFSLLMNLLENFFTDIITNNSLELETVVNHVTFFKGNEVIYILPIPKLTLELTE